VLRQSISNKRTLLNGYCCGLGGTGGGTWSPWLVDVDRRLPPNDEGAVVELRAGCEQ